MTMSEIKLNPFGGYEAMYLIYVNDYLTVEKFAEDHNITEYQANVIIEVGRALNNKEI